MEIGLILINLTIRVYKKKNGFFNEIYNEKKYEMMILNDLWPCTVYYYLHVTFWYVQRSKWGCEESAQTSTLQSENTMVAPDTSIKVTTNS